MNQTNDKHGKRVPLMRRKLARRKVVPVVIGILAILILPRFVLVPAFWYGYAEWTAWRYAVNPTPERNLTLIYLTHRGYVSEAHALKLLRDKARPEVMMRENYPSGSTPRALVVSNGAAAGWRWEFEFEDGEGLIPGQNPPPAFHGGLHRTISASDTPVIARHIMFAEHRYPQPGNGFPFDVLPRWTFGGEVLPATQLLEYRFSVKAEPVWPEEFDDLEFVSTPELDEAVKESIASKVLPMTPCIRIRSYGGTVVAASAEELLLTFNDLPADLVMETELIIPNETSFVPPMSGTLVDDVYFRNPYHDLTLVALEGTTGKSARFYDLGDITTVGDYYSPGPGTYDCILRLTTDRKSAMIDPRVHRVWDGTLEFPVLLEVTHEIPVQRMRLDP